MKNINRRMFLSRAALAAGALAVPVTSNAADAPVAKGSMHYRTLGRTGLKVSEIGFGGYSINKADVIDHAVDLGVNYFDTANCYPEDSELTFGKAFSGKRDKVIIATKWCPHHIYKAPTKANFIAQLDNSLQRMKTDYVDVLFNHQMGPSDGVTNGTNFSRLDNPELLEAWETVKKAGKARYFGVSGHEGNLMEVMNHVVDSGRFDVVLCRYNFMNYPSQMDLIKKCASKNIGFIAMKTLAGAKGAEVAAFKDKMSSAKQAALKWVLSNKSVSNLIISMTDKSQVDEYAAASGKSMTAADVALLDEYRARFSSEICRMASDCEPACPHHVLVSDVLRASMYFHEYREEKHGITEYASLPASRQAHHCVGCSAPCQKVCPHDLPIRNLLMTAHKSLSIRPGGS